MVRKGGSRLRCGEALSPFAPQDETAPDRSLRPRRSTLISQTELGFETQSPRENFQMFGIPQTHTLKVLGMGPVIPFDADQFRHEIAMHDALLGHEGVAPALFVGNDEVRADMIRIGQIQVQPASGSHEPGQFGEQPDIVATTLQITEPREEARDQPARSGGQGNRTQVATKDGSARRGRLQKMRGEVAPECGKSLIAQREKVASIPTAGIQGSSWRHPGEIQQGAHLDPRLVEAAVPVKTLVFFAKPVFKPVRRRGVAKRRDEIPYAIRASSLRVRAWRRLPRLPPRRIPWEAMRRPDGGAA